jgi:hypothetical protein
MQSIDEDELYREPIDLLLYCKEKKIDLNKPIKIIRWGIPYEELTIATPLLLHSNSYDYIKLFIENGFNVNITNETKYNSFFKDLLNPSSLEELKICLPYFNLRKNRELMWHVYYWLKRPNTYGDEFKEILQELISKFNQKTWKRNLKRFTTEKHYTATTAAEFYDSYPMLY